MIHQSEGRLATLRRFPTLYGIAWALFLAAIGTLFVSFWAHFGNLSATHIVVAAYIVHCISVLCGGFTASKCAHERGWYHGAIVGLFYALIMTGIGVVIFNTFSMDAGGFFRILIMVLIAAFGGIIGVNAGKSRM